MVYVYFSGRFSLSNRKVAGILFSFVLLLLSFTGHAQSFFYMDAKLESTAGKPVDYHLLLRIDPSGVAVSRIVYMDAVTGQQRLVEQKFVDSIINGNAVEDGQHVLYPSGEPSYLDGLDATGFIEHRIGFLKKTDSAGSYYVPTVISYSINSGEWKQAVLETVEEKSLQQLRADEAFTSIFYTPKEPQLAELLSPLSSRGLNKQEQSARIHLIAIANTLDPSIGASAKKDLTRVVQTFLTISQKAGIQFSPVIISEGEFNKKNVEAKINMLKPNKNDIVVFYYSGHGYRKPSDVSNWQRMSLRTSQAQDIDENSLGVEAVYNQLLKKGAGFTLVIGDCCNVIVKDAVGRGPEPLRSRGLEAFGPTLNMENFRTLFFPARPLGILAGAADKDQLAIGNPSLGGFFTHFLLTELTMALTGNQPKTWQGMLTAAKENTGKQSLSAICGTGRCIQRAVLKLSANGN